MTMKKIDYQHVKSFIEAQSPETKIYLGADSECFRMGGKWYADYFVVVVVHIDGCHGCKIFGEITREPVYDQKKERPALRLLTETYKVAEAYAKLADVIGDRTVEIHLDINPNELYGSSCALQQAVGYIRGTCNVEPIVKPHSFAAQFAADRFREIQEWQAKAA